jgi:phosphatidylglycerophosphate synthase
MAASRGGKVKTALQAFALTGLIMPLRDFTGAWEPVGEVLWWVAVLAMAAAVVVTLVTGADYVRDAARIRREGRTAAGS